MFRLRIILGKTVRQLVKQYYKKRHDLYQCFIGCRGVTFLCRFCGSSYGIKYKMNRLLSHIASQRRRNLLKRDTMTSTQGNEPQYTIKDMPHPKSLPLIGTKLQLLAAGSGVRLHEYIDQRHKKLGPIFYEKLGGSTKLVFISDPVFMKTLFLNLEGKHPMHLLPDPWILYEKLYGYKRGLFFMNGEEWLNHRRVTNKHLLKEDVEKWIAEPVQSTVAKFIKGWKKEAENDNFVPNLESEFYRFSTDVIISILLGNNQFERSKQSDMLLELFSESVKRIFQNTTKLYGLPVEWYQKLNLKVWREFKDCVDLSLSLAQKIVSEILEKRHETNGLIKRLCDENLSDEIITRIVADFIIAAGDTTAHTSLWTMYLVSKNTKITEEIQNKKHDFVRYVVKETMRLYPVAPFLTRILPKESTMGIYKLESGTPVIASIYTSGRDELNFSQADQFLPYRWDRNDPRRNELTNHVPSASLPFALGARSCIGKKIAMIQMTELVYQIVNNFDLKCLNETEVKPITSQVLVPNRDIKVAVSLRSSTKK